MTTDDFGLAQDELRVVARYAVEAAQSVLVEFERARPDDSRPRVAVEAAWTFVHGAPRSTLQRVASVDAHRAAKEAPTESARLAAQAAGDAAAAAYLHPIAKGHQVGHILRAPANAARVAEIEAGDDPRVGESLVEQARLRATPALIDILCRYPPVPVGKSRATQLMNALDAALRSRREETRSKSCDECGATGRGGPCSEAFMTLLALDHERRQPWGEYHALNVACYLLQHPSQTKGRSLSGHWQIVDTFLAEGLGAVHALTTRAVRRNNARAGQGPAIGGMSVPELTSLPLMTIEDVAVDGTFPAHGYPERMLCWAQATAQSRSPCA